jgi:hypothetical protein
MNVGFEIDQRCAAQLQRRIKILVTNEVERGSAMMYNPLGSIKGIYANS